MNAVIIDRMRFFLYNNNIMKSSLTIILIAIFAVSAIFGFFAMNHMVSHESGVCGTAKAQGLASCFEILNSFSATIPSQNVLKFIFITLLLLSAIIAASITVALKSAPSGLFYWKQNFSKSYPYSFKNYFLRWLALYENSPAAPSF